MEVSDYCRDLANGASDRRRLRHRSAVFKNNCNVDVAHPSINASLGVTASLRDASLAGNLAINSTRLAVWGPLVSEKCRRCTGRECCGCDRGLLCKLLSGRCRRRHTRGNNCISDRFTLDVLRRRVAVEDGMCALSTHTSRQDNLLLFDYSSFTEDTFAL